MLEEEWKAPQSLRELEVVRELGVGSYARVLHVRRRSNGEEYALKVMNKAFLLRENKGEAVKRERELLELLCGTPGMVRLAFSFQDALSVYLATEVCHGDLQAQLARRPGGRADAWEARFWTAELALALHALHAHSCVHRDVKPENVLLDARGHVRLCDFGSAKRLDALPAPPRAPPPGTRVRNGTFAGTAEYCAPELIQGLATSCAADFWSLGCLLFQALSGRPPFKGATEYLTFQLVLSRALTFPDTFPADARACVEALLVSDPKGRCCTLAALQATPFLAQAPWDGIWEAQAPQVLPEPPAEAGTEADADAFDTQAAPSSQACPPGPPWRLQALETVVLQAPARRKRGLALQEGLLTLTSCGRVALLALGQARDDAPPLLLASAASAARLRAVDHAHLALRTDAGEEAFVELCDAHALRWVELCAAAAQTEAVG